MNLEKVIPQYIQVAETISSRITNGRYPSNILPSSRELEKDFSVSDITIRKALNVLVQQNEILRKRGVGTTIRQHNRHRKFDYFGNFRELIDSKSGQQVNAETEVLEIKITESYPDEIRDILELDKGVHLWQMQRLRKHNGEPVSYFVNYGHVELFENIKKQDIKNKTFIETADSICNVKFSKMEQWVEVEIADSDLASLMKTKFAAPMFFAKNIYYLDSAKPVAVTYMHFRGDKYKFFRNEDISINPNNSKL